MSLCSVLHGCCQWYPHARPVSGRMRPTARLHRPCLFTIQLLRAVHPASKRLLQYERDAQQLQHGVVLELLRLLCTKGTTTNGTTAIASTTMHTSRPTTTIAAGTSASFTPWSISRYITASSPSAAELVITDCILVCDFTRSAGCSGAGALRPGASCLWGMLST